MPSKRVLFLVDVLAPGGLASVVITLARRMAELGHVVGVAVLEPLVAQNPGPDVWLKVQPQSRPPGGQAGFRKQAADFGNSAIKEFEDRFGTADLIVAAGEMALRCAPSWHHPRMVFSSHSSQLGSPKQAGLAGRLRHRFKQWRRGRRLQHLLDGRHVHVVSSGLAAELRRDFGVRPASVDVIPNPFDVADLRRRAHGATPESRVVGSPFIVGVGAFSPNKRFDRLVRAFAESGIDGALVLIGQGPEEGALREIVVELGIGQRVHFLPFHPNHYALVARARLLALTSNSEGLGNVLIEALILGVPALSTDCPHGPRDILGGLDPRALVPMDRLELLPDRLRELVRQPYAIPEAAVARYELDHVVERYLALTERFAAD